MARNDFEGGHARALAKENAWAASFVAQPQERDRPETMAACSTSRLVPQVHTQRHLAGLTSGIFSMSAQRP
jgi:hypothetical protein